MDDEEPLAVRAVRVSGLGRQADPLRALQLAPVGVAVQMFDLNVGPTSATCPQPASNKEIRVSYAMAKFKFECLELTRLELIGPILAAVHHKADISRWRQCHCAWHVR